MRRAIMPSVAMVAAVFSLAGTDCGGGTHSAASCTDHGGIASEISGNHGHELRVPAADFAAPDAGASYSYSIRGTATHDHTVVFTGAQLRVVSGLNSATVESSSTEGHTHMVTLDCSSL